MDSSRDSAVIEPEIASTSELSPEAELALEQQRLFSAGSLEREERRRAQRAPAALRVRVVAKSLDGTEVFSRTATLANFSLDGACLSGIPSGELPQISRDIGLEFIVLEGELAGMTARFEPVRDIEDGSGIGVALIGGFSLPV